MTSPAPPRQAPLLIHGGALGDLVLTIQMLTRGGIARDGLVVLSRVSLEGLSDASPPLWTVSPEAVGLHQLFAESGRASPALAPLVRDRVVVNALTHRHSPIHERLASALPRRLYSFDPAPRPGQSRHITDQWLDDLRRQGWVPTQPLDWHDAQLQPGDAMITAGRAMLAARGVSGPPVALLPGSGGRAKCWPLPNFIALAGHVSRRGATPYFILGPAELERWSRPDLDTVRDCAPCIEAPSNRELASILACAACVVGNDSGPTHLASWLGRPVTAVFGPTSPEVWRPMGRYVRILAGRPHASDRDWGLAPETVADSAFAGPDAPLPRQAALDPPLVSG